MLCIEIKNWLTNTSLALPQGYLLGLVFPIYVGFKGGKGVAMLLDNRAIIYANLIKMKVVVLPMVRVRLLFKIKKISIN